MKNLLVVSFVLKGNHVFVSKKCQESGDRNVHFMLAFLKAF